MLVVIFWAIILISLLRTGGLPKRSMAATNGALIPVIIILMTQEIAFAMNKLKEIYHWDKIDYVFPDNRTREVATESKKFIAKNCIIMGFERWGDKMFITTPRLRPGVPSTLNYIMITDNTKSPPLVPYPSWEMNEKLSTGNHFQKLSSVYSVRVDPCNRLWVLDNGVINELTETTIENPRGIYVFNLQENQLIRAYMFKDSDYTSLSSFRNIVVDVTSSSCENAFAYTADITGAIVVYSWIINKSHRVVNNYFHFDPLHSLTVTSTGRKYPRADGIFGMALSSPDREGYRRMFFHPIQSTIEFGVSTKILQNKSLGSTYHQGYYVMGDRGHHMKSSASVIDMETEILFYTTVEKDGVACWNIYSDKDIEPSNQGLIADEDKNMIYPNDIRVDKSGNLWVLSNQFADYIYDELDVNSVPYHIYMGPVRQIIRGTQCKEI